MSAPPSPRDVSMEIDSPENMMRHIRFLKNEVERLKKSLRTTELQRKWPLVPAGSDLQTSDLTHPRLAPIQPFSTTPEGWSPSQLPGTGGCSTL